MTNLNCQSTTVELVYTDGKNPRVYNGYPERLGGHIYQISTSYVSGNCKPASCNIYVYTLYECELDYTSCILLPIQYTEDYDVAIVLDADKTTNEINAYDSYDDTMIFTYEQYPICYVKGCVILDQ